MNLKNKSRLFFFLCFGLIFHLSCDVDLYAQNSREKDALKVFARFEEGIAEGSVDKFSIFFGTRNYLSLSNGVSGYYSANQSYYVIKDFLSINEPTSFKLTNIVSETSTPFASGILKYNSNGIRKNANVFISLQRMNKNWYISQITIN